MVARMVNAWRRVVGGRIRWGVRWCVGKHVGIGIKSEQEEDSRAEIHVRALFVCQRRDLVLLPRGFCLEAV